MFTKDLILFKSGLEWYASYKQDLYLLDKKGWDSEEAFLKQTLSLTQFFSKVAKSTHTWRIEKL